MQILKYFIAGTILTTSLHCNATVGGEQFIEVLGYEAKEQKLYVMRHYEDGRSRLPQLYYYQLNSKTPERLIEVQSLYINPKTKKIDYDQDGIQFEKDIAQIKKRLTPLLVGNNQTAKIQILSHSTKHIPFEPDSIEGYDEYTTTYKVKTPDFQSKNQIAVNYDKKFKITQNFIIPKQNKLLIVIQYLGIPFETGYNMEDPVLLQPKK
ncbi:MAG: hypothetical protein RR569_11480 [Acinetobacter sp.]